MARKQTGRGPVGRPPKPDGDERAKLVAFRVHDLREALDVRAGHESKRGTVARRDLQRYYSLMEPALKSIDATPADVAAIADYLKDELELKQRVTVRLFGPAVGAAASAIGRESLADLSDVQSMALLDLFSRTASPAEAGEVFAVETGA